MQINGQVASLVYGKRAASNHLSATMAKSPPKRRLRLVHALTWMRIGMAALMLMGLFLVATQTTAHQETSFQGEDRATYRRPPGCAQLPPRSWHASSRWCHVARNAARHQVRYGSRVPGRYGPGSSDNRQQRRPASPARSFSPSRLPADAPVQILSPGWLSSHPVVVAWH